MDTIRTQNIGCLPKRKLCYNKNKYDYRIVDKQNIIGLESFDKYYSQIAVINKNFMQNKTNKLVSFGHNLNFTNRQGDVFSFLYRRNVGIEDFKDVLDVHNLVLNRKLLKGQKIKELIFGVAYGEEPASYATITAEAIKDTNISLEKILDLNLVDLNQAPTINFECNNIGYAPSCFDKASKTDPFSGVTKEYYTLKSHISEYLQKIYDDCNPDNPKAKSRWGTDIRDFVKTGKNAMYDIISCNNVFWYIDSPEDIKYVIQNFDRMLTPDGFLIIDADMDNLVSSACNDLYNCRPGIYAKSRKDQLKLKSSYKPPDIKSATQNLGEMLTNNVTDANMKEIISSVCKNLL